MNSSIFQSVARDSFRFLQDELGFSEFHFSENCPDYYSVGYSNQMLRVEVFFSVSDGNEVGVLISNSDRSSYSFHTYLRLVDRERANKFGGAMAKDDSEIVELLEMFAEALRTIGRPLLIANTLEFQRLQRAEDLGEGLMEYDPPSNRYNGGGL